MVAKKKATDVLNRTRSDVVTPLQGGITTRNANVRHAERVVSFGKAQFRVYSVGHLAARMNRTSATLRRWHRDKVIPDPIIKLTDGNRWYLEEEIDIYVRVAIRLGVRNGISIEDTGFPMELRQELSVLRERLQRTINEKNGKQGSSKS